MAAAASPYHGAGPGIMEAQTRAPPRECRSIGCNIEMPFEQGANPYVIRSSTSDTSSFGSDVLKYSSAFIIFPAVWHMDELFEAQADSDWKIYSFQ